jgi:hypothetical protein
VAKLLNIFADLKDADQQKKLLRGLFIEQKRIRVAPWSKLADEPRKK